MNEHQISNLVFNAGLKVHKSLGPGLLESAPQECLFYELLMTGLNVSKQAALPLIYQEVKLEVGYRIDLLLKKNLSLKLNQSMPSMISTSHKY